MPPTLAQPMGTRATALHISACVQTGRGYSEVSAVDGETKTHTYNAATLPTHHDPRAVSSLGTPASRVHHCSIRELTSRSNNHRTPSFFPRQYPYEARSSSKQASPSWRSDLKNLSSLPEKAVDSAPFLQQGSSSSSYPPAASVRPTEASWR